jgi:ATP-dependent Clp protease ATP-binding subunit ClpC
LRCDKTPTVDANEIKMIVNEITGIPISGIGSEIDYGQIEKNLKRRIFGQDRAIRHLTSAVKRGSVGINDPDRPKGIFLFLGESGVGKTALAKAFSDETFAKENALIRLDMSEFGESNATTKLIGSPPGYIGYEEGGKLTERVRRHPYSVVLLDEIEKASDEVLNLLLQIMDEGMLGDAGGRRISFKNTYIIMTSNIGANFKKSSGGVGFISKEQSEDLKGLSDMLKERFKPEFINRIDEIILFNSLTEANLKEIAKNILDSLVIRLRAMKINLKYSDTVLDHIASKSFISGFGARPLARFIINEIENKISELLLNDASVKCISIIADSGVLLFKCEREEMVVK